MGYPGNEQEYWCEKFNEEQRNITLYYQELMWQHGKPSYLYKPRLFLDGNKWCALFGEDIQNGVAGFGDSPQKAFDDFDSNWNKSI